mgnify:CR=1 FL=1
MAKYKVLVTARSFSSAGREALDYLWDHGCEVIRLQGGEEERKHLLPQVDAVIAGLESYDRAALESAPKLKVISRYGVGYDKVDLSAAKERGIAITITAGANENSVADLAVALMLACARNIPLMNESVKKGTAGRPIGLEMWRKTLGVVGVGRIGKGVVRRAAGFEMRILCYDMDPDRKFAAQYGAKYVDLDTLIRESDFITLHTPYNEKTKNMISERQLQSMKRSAVLVNTARGGLIDEEALYRALKDRMIYAAALDAVAAESSCSSPLCGLGNCILTPHAGATTVDAVCRMSMQAARNAVDVLETGTCRFSV